MASTRDVLLAALDRWVGRELIDTELERKLRADVEELTARERARWSQYALAATGAVVLLIAAGAFVTWAWPDMGPAARVGVLVVAAVTVQVLGMALQGRERWVPPSYLMQTAGLGILLAAVAYSENAWSDGTPGAVAIGLIGLLFPTGTAVLSIRRGPVMPAVHAAAGFAFLGLFLDRTFPLDGDIVIWILDGVLVLALLVLGHQIRAGLGEEGSDWVLNAFAATLWVGLVLVLLTAAEPLDLEDAAVVPVNAWWLLLVAITLWGIHRAPPALQRSWFDLELGLTVLLGIVLAFWTGDGLLDLSPVGTAAVVGSFGVIWLRYGVSRESRPVILAACVALVSAAWSLGVREAGALGAVLALAFTGALLFWVSARLGARQESLP